MARLSRLGGLAGIALAALALAGCGGGDGDSAGDLVWVGEPRLVTPPNLPRDRILGGEVRNDSLRRVELEARDLRLLGAGGDEVPGTAVFLGTFAHQLFPPTREPEGGIPESERLRLGVKAKVDPGERVPLTVSWRQRPGRKPPVRIDTGDGFLTIP